MSNSVDTAHAKRVEFCYRYYDCLSELIGKSDYTEGMYHGNRSLSFEEAQDNQVQHLIDQAQVTRGMTILELGCGRGRLLEAARARGVNAIGITISEEQVRYCRQRGLDARLLDYRHISDDWTGRFDAVIANGSMEHFVSRREGLDRRASSIYRDLFALVHRILSPSSPSRRFVTTVIHRRAPYGQRHEMSPPTMALFLAINEIYSGWYPLDGQLEQCAVGHFHAVQTEDGTQDWLWTSEDLFRDYRRRLTPTRKNDLRAITHFLRTVGEAGPRAPLFLLNPYLWTAQFRGNPPPTVLRRHTWSAFNP